MQQRTVNIHEAKTHLSRLIDAVLGGQEIIIAKAGKPMVRLAPLKKRMQPRQPGALKGRIRIADDFDAPLPDDVTAAFRGERP